jgi:hypothetical protein
LGNLGFPYLTYRDETWLEHLPFAADFPSYKPPVSWGFSSHVWLPEGIPLNILLSAIVNHSWALFNHNYPSIHNVRNLPPTTLGTFKRSCCLWPMSIARVPNPQAMWVSSNWWWCHIIVMGQTMIWLHVQVFSPHSWRIDQLVNAAWYWTCGRLRFGVHASQSGLIGRTLRTLAQVGKWRFCQVRKHSIRSPSAQQLNSDGIQAKPR